MDIARALPLAVLAVASAVVFLLMRYPGLRREPFQRGRAFSTGLSLACAIGLFAVFGGLAWWLQR